MAAHWRWGASNEDSASNVIDGDQNDDTAGFAGAVYVFIRSGVDWSQQAYVKASNADENDQFGNSVALSADGSTLAVGASNEDSASNVIDGDQNDNTSPNAGAVYVFIRSGVDWSQQAYVKASNADENDQFGNSVALSADGSTLAVGAYLEDSAATVIGGDETDDTATSAGAVYVFSRSGVDWSQQAYVKASNTDSGDVFGYSVALSADGNALAVGARREESAATGIDGGQADDTSPDAGAVYVFSRSSGIWSQQAYVKASNTDDGDWFGYSVALTADGSTMAASARREASAATGINGDQGNNDVSRAGAVYLY